MWCNFERYEWYWGVLFPFRGTWMTRMAGLVDASRVIGGTSIGRDCVILELALYQHRHDDAHISERRLHVHFRPRSSASQYCKGNFLLLVKDEWDPGCSPEIYVNVSTYHRNWGVNTVEGVVKPCGVSSIANSAIRRRTWIVIAPCSSSVNASHTHAWIFDV